ncbi:hypothetical protein QTI05_22740 [Variovorax sp. J22R193]|uniref:DnaT-like ssDNA-binding protein n=1 Tax=Variovorax fucosicus TaxID=3053517 RepID=UPI002576CC08|nr:DnaT-like ssDNA-binding protein [Variovorax sp. J22R193]MDM0041876.1 hypothetical protein [Variovorax sp. J22R193]
MALVVAPTEPAEAYISVAAADAYFLARGNATWAALTTTQKEQNLRKGADFMGQVYGTRWQGYRVSSTQALDWPRSGVVAFDFDVPYTSIPTAIANANAEFALRASTGELLADQGRATKREKVGPLEVEYMDYATMATTYPAINGMLLPYLNGSGGTFRKVVRT